MIYKQGFEHPDGMSRTEGRTAGSGTARGTQTPEQHSAIETLQWCGEFLSRRAEILVPAVALGALEVLFAVGLLAGIPPGQLSVVRLVVYLPASVLVAGIIALAVTDDVGGRWRSIGEYASEASGNLVEGIVVAVVVGIAVGVGLVFLIVPGLYLIVRFAFAIPSVFVDDRGITEALGESWSRTKGYGWSLFGIVVALFVVSLLAQGAAVLDSPLLSAVVGGLVTAVATPLTMGSFTFLYLTTRAPETRAQATATGRDAGTRQGQRPASGQPAASQATPAERAGGQERSTGGRQPAGQGSQTGTQPGASRGQTPPAETGQRANEPGETGSQPPGSEQSQPSQPQAGRSGQPTERRTRTESGSDSAPDGTAEPNGDRGAPANGPNAGTAEAGGGLPDEETARIAQLTDEVDAGEAGPERIAPLIGLLDSEFPAVRREAATALGTLGARYPDRADEAIDALQDVRLDQDTEVSEAASDAVRRIKDHR
jgi:hypothetical protein